MLIRSFAVAAGLFLISSGAVAQDGGQAQAPAPVKEKKICRASAATGSIMAKRQCKTKAEWAKSTAEGEKQAENFRDRQSQNGRMGTTQ